MAYRIEVERRAQKALVRLPGADRAQIAVAIDGLAVNPRPPACRPVRAAPKGSYRIRIGDCRIVYLVLDDERIVIVARVVRRSESTYRELP